jgi:hypothetical protein
MSAISEPLKISSFRKKTFTQMTETELMQQVKKDKVSQRTKLRYSNAQIAHNNNSQQIQTYFRVPFRQNF